MKNDKNAFDRNHTRAYVRTYSNLHTIARLSLLKSNTVGSMSKCTLLYEIMYLLVPIL